MPSTVHGVVPRPWPTPRPTTSNGSGTGAACIAGTATARAPSVASSGIPVVPRTLRRGPLASVDPRRKRRARCGTVHRWFRTGPCGNRRWHPVVSARLAASGPPSPPSMPGVGAGAVTPVHVESALTRGGQDAFARPMADRPVAPGADPAGHERAKPVDAPGFSAARAHTDHTPPRPRVCRGGPRRVVRRRTSDGVARRGGIRQGRGDVMPIVPASARRAMPDDATLRVLVPATA